MATDKRRIVKYRLSFPLEAQDGVFPESKRYVVSADWGLPTGAELKEDLCEILASGSAPYGKVGVLLSVAYHDKSGDGEGSWLSTPSKAAGTLRRVCRPDYFASQLNPGSFGTAIVQFYDKSKIVLEADK